MREIVAVTSRLNIDRGLFFHLNVAAFLCLCAYFVIKSQHQINGTNAEKNDHHCLWWHSKPTITIMTICNLALSLTSSIFFARDDLDTVLKLSALVWRHSIVSLCLIWSANRLFSLPIAYIFFGARCIYFEFSWINGPFTHIKILFLLLSDKHQPATEINSFSYRCCVHFFCLHLGFWSIMVISLSFVTRICNENDQKISEYETEMYEGKKREVELMPNDRKMYMHLTCLIHFLLSVQFISIAVKEKRSARAGERKRNKYNKSTFDFLSMQNALINSHLLYFIYSIWKSRPIYIFNWPGTCFSTVYLNLNKYFFGLWYVFSSFWAR